MSKNHGLDPLKPAFTVYHHGGNDLDLAWETLNAYGTEQEAVDAAKDCVDEHGGMRVIYKLVPVVVVERGKTRVRHL